MLLLISGLSVSRSLVHLSQKIQMISLQCIAPSSCIAGQSLTATVAAFIKVCLASAPSSLSTTAGYLLTTSSLSLPANDYSYYNGPTDSHSQAVQYRKTERGTCRNESIGELSGRMQQQQDSPVMLHWIQILFNLIINVDFATLSQNNATEKLK